MKIPELIERNKYLFGAYSTMAIMNIRTVLEHIQKSVGIERNMEQYSVNDEVCENYFKHPAISSLRDGKYPEKTAATFEKLLNGFPFMETFIKMQTDYNIKNKYYSSQEDIFYNIFCLLFRVLKKYRNYTSHYQIKDDDWNDGSKFLNKESGLSYKINDFYTVSLREITSKYKYTTADLAFIQNNRYKLVKDKNGRKMAVNTDFFLSMQNFNSDRILHLSGVGVVLLISLFLEKKYINIFLSKLHINGGYSEQSKEYEIIKRSLNNKSIVLPKERIRPEKKDFTLAMDMLNELKCCPKELFDTFSHNDQSAFRALSSDHNEVLHVRHTDRFAQLVLQYIDYNKLFESIRFHVNMGKLRYLFSPDKLCIDGEHRVRVIEHPLNGYGRMEEMENYRKNPSGCFGDSNIKIRDFENIVRDDADKNNYPYIVDTYTHYLLNNNKIEFCFCNDKIVPKIVSSGTKWYAEKEMPSCRMSILELPAMLFHLLLLGSKKTESRIKKVYDNYKKLFDALRNGTLTKDNVDSFGISRTDMPKKVIDFLNSVKVGKNYNDFIRKTLQEEIDNSKILLKKIEEDISSIEGGVRKIGKRGYRQILPGKLADFLAKDIVKYQPTLCDGDFYGTDRMTGLNFRVMQAAIAKFNCNINVCAADELHKMFREAGLVDGDQRHPFLINVLQRAPKTTVDFYKYYLRAKVAYLNSLKNEIRQGSKLKLPFVNNEKNKWMTRDEDFYKTMGDIYLEDISIEMPRQMFDSDIKAELRKCKQMENIDFENANVTFLIGEYMKRVLNDENQIFYSFQRNYTYIDMLKCVPDSNGTLYKQFTTVDERETIWKERDKRTQAYISWKQQHSTKSNKQNIAGAELASRVVACRNDYQKTEKLIRRYKAQDALLFMLAERTLRQNSNIKASEFQLKHINPNSEKGILSESMPMDFVFEKAGTRYTIHSGCIKIKNIGDFYSIAHDKRLVNLLRILSTDTIEKDKVEQEFGNYDNCRCETVKSIFEFEKEAYEKYPEFEQLMNLADHFDFKELLSKLVDKGAIDNERKEILRLIRNAFCHSTYPNDTNIIEHKVLPAVAINLTRKFNMNKKIE